MAQRRLQRLLGHLERDPTNPVLRKAILREACTFGGAQSVLGVAEEGLRQHPDDVEMLVLAGCSYLQGECYAEAEQALAAAVARGCAAVEVRYNLAYARFLQRHYELALEPLDSLTSFELPQSLVLRARCLHHLGRREEAIADCRAYLAHASTDAETNGMLALLLCEDGDRMLARRHADAALLRNPLQAEARLALASLHADADADAPAERSVAVDFDVRDPDTIAHVQNLEDLRDLIPHGSFADAELARDHRVA